eukprot:CAMPEP_0180046608 /NCGR_PEP_ID=MMETSP0984-20121128/37315_1 /TAXON_ID=483367 /ORGANISM="non described non described, Strain CCMP 2436" /LENGTH=53 /DNA_ID=CAMNT_0021975389 /DNA_START=95 /DNA_END=256 /DNA_ORIENTATION=+
MGAADETKLPRQRMSVVHSRSFSNACVSWTSLACPVHSAKKHAWSPPMRHSCY